MTPIRILLVDDHILFREGLSSLLSAQPDFMIVGEAGNVRDAIALSSTLKPEIILMDFSLPDGTGLDATQAILAESPGIAIVFMTMHEENENLFAAVRSGARGYLLKNVPVSRLLALLRGVPNGDAAISASMAARIMTEFSRIKPASFASDQQEIEGLTARETEVLSVLASGATNREIAERLVVTENTIKNHVRNILAKLHLKNRREAARFARRVSA